MALTGNYDVLTVPFLLPKTTLAPLLPQPAGESLLLPLPPSLLEAIPLPYPAGFDLLEDVHLVLLQLGHQHGTGPGPIKMSFQEAKLEVPFVRHPKLVEQDSPKKDEEFLYKQTCIFSNRLIVFGSQYMTGLDSHLASFEPNTSPSNYPADSSSIEYNTKAFFDVNATLLTDGEQRQQIETNAETITKLAEIKWYGDRTGDTITQFNFEKPSIGPVGYQVKVELDLTKFKKGRGGEGGGEDQLKIETIGIRTKSDFIAKESKLKDVV